MEALLEKDRCLEHSPKVLGTKWNSETDQMELHASINEPKKWTKRTISGAIAQIYDPTGYLAPLLVEAKLFLQQLWNDYDWDTILKSEKEAEWKAIVARVADFKKLIPRCVTPLDQEVNIAMFSDANQDTMAACLYVIHGGRAHLMMSKSKQRQLKTVMTIPKMELNAFKIGVCLVNTVMTELRKRIKVKSLVLFSDSQVTISWIQSTTLPTGQGQYVENRWRASRKLFDEIIEEFHVTPRIAYVNTNLNPADVPQEASTRSSSKTTSGGTDRTSSWNPKTNGRSSQNRRTLRQKPTAKQCWSLATQTLLHHQSSTGRRRIDLELSCVTTRTV
ncbi:hypothetical protein L596_022588 [Steinernema carpocapsae]|uniref:Uncharacterized protein n=1 Tax=Steinernema carpocapsae TaxID=34508 RepID=A0A4U5MN05_STECR|nr:hypothetical protein L596_022588 [Steinernema carpocapsae]